MIETLSSNMPKYIIDVNIPYKIQLFKNDDFVSVVNINDEWTDEQIWNYAKKNELTIITKDADFSLKIIMNNPPPKVIHFKIGNLKFNDFNNFIQEKWNKIIAISSMHKLTNVFIDRIEGIE